MSNELEVRENLEKAISEYVRASRPDLENMFVQDYVIAIASECMDEGHENVTYFNHLNRPGMPGYSVVGLLDMSITYFRNENQPRG